MREGHRNQEPGTRGTGLTGPLSPSPRARRNTYVIPNARLRNVWEWRLLSDPRKDSWQGCGRFAFSIAATKLLKPVRRTRVSVKVTKCQSDNLSKSKGAGSWIIDNYSDEEYYY